RPGQPLRGPPGGRVGWSVWACAAPRPACRGPLRGRGAWGPSDGFRPQRAYVARQVVDERVVVVDQQDHGASAAIQPRALSSVSAYSFSGSESATIPPPA